MNGGGCMAITEQDLELPALPASVRDGRRFVDQALDALGAQSVRDVAALLTSELVTNAIVHAGGTMVLRVTSDGSTVRVGVRDRSTAKPHRRRWKETSLSGRGIGLVDRLAARWGIDLLDGDAGKEVWFELRL